MKQTANPGYATCPACSVLGTPQEERQAVPTSDDRVLCLACKRVTSKFADPKLVADMRSLPDCIREVVMALISTNEIVKGRPTPPTYSFNRVSGSGGESYSDSEQDRERAAAACAQHAVGYLIEEASRKHVDLSYGPYGFHTLRLSYKSDKVQSCGRADLSGDVRVVEIQDRLTMPEKHAVLVLAKLGFRLNGSTLDASIRHVHLLRGSGEEGVHAEFTWYP